MAENYYGISDIGKTRVNNEDAFIAQKVLENKFILACVIDGLGGYEGGEIAAQLARDAIIDKFKKLPENFTELLKDAVVAVHNAIEEGRKANSNYNQMACVLTLAMVDLENNKLYYAHVGDTRMYLFRDLSLVKLTHDHSFVGLLEDSGRLSEEAAMHHPKRHEINKAVGFEAFTGDDNYIETGESPFLPGDIILLCSDGLSDLVDEAGMTAVLSSTESLQAKAKALTDAANDAGGKDNITLVLVHNNKATVKQDATKPIGVKQTYIASKPQEDLSIAVKQKIVAPKKKRSIAPFLFFLCLLLMAAVAWLLYEDYQNKKQHEKEIKNRIIERKHTPEEQLLADSIAKTATGEVFVINQSTSPPIVITDSITITNDTLHILGNGVHLVCDTAYKGAAFILSGKCKHILLDSITFENFDVGAIVKNRSLHLKNVQFKNCRVPLQFNFMFAEQPIIHGRFADTVFYNTDITP